MNPALLTLVLALVWTAITGSFSALNLFFGVGVSIIALYVLRGRMARPRAVRRLRRIGSLVALFVYDLVLSAVRVALVVMDPRMNEKIRPAIIAVPLDVTTEAEITVLASFLSLTPGSMSLDVSEDNKFLYIHVLNLTTKEEEVANIKNEFERRVLEIFEDEWH